MISKKKRDVKFMIYLGLYLFIIAFITSQGATLMDIGAEIKTENDTIISKKLIDSVTKLPTYNEEKEMVVRKPDNDKGRYEFLSQDEIKIKKETLEEKEREISNLKSKLSSIPVQKKSESKKNVESEVEGLELIPKNSK